MKILADFKPETYSYKKMWMSEKAKKLKLQDEVKKLKQELRLKTKPWLA